MNGHLSSRIAVIGSGPGGLIAAAILIRDGFKHVKVFTKDSGPGGTWARENLYPDQQTNGAFFDFSYSGSDNEYTSEELKQADSLTGQIAGTAVATYLERFAAKYLPSQICYATTVTSLRRPANATTGWELQLRRNGEDTVETFDKVVIASGNFHYPHFPAGLDAATTKFNGVFAHTSQMAKAHQAVLDAVPPMKSQKEGEKHTAVVIGGGKSAADIAIWLSLQGRHVVLVMRECLRYIPVPERRIPDWIRKSRVVLLFQPTIDLDTRIARFLHNTTIGASITRFCLSRAEAQNSKFGLKEGDALYPRTPILWGARAAGPSKPRDPHSLHNLVRDGKIEVIAPAYFSGFTPDGDGILLDNGQIIKTSAVIFGTGFESSWRKFVSKEVIEEIGLSPRPPPSNAPIWDYKILQDPPFKASQDPAPLYFRGLIPAENFDARDFAIIGEARSVGGFHVQEVSAHWIASYFREDPFFKPTKQSAIQEAEREVAWLRQRYPTRDCWSSSSCNTGDALANWPKYCDRLLLDMDLPIYRSGGGPFWFLKPISKAEIATLNEERAEKRASFV